MYVVTVHSKKNVVTVLPRAREMVNEVQKLKEGLEASRSISGMNLCGKTEETEACHL